MKIMKVNKSLGELVEMNIADSLWILYNGISDAYTFSNKHEVAPVALWEKVQNLLSQTLAVYRTRFYRAMSSENRLIRNCHLFLALKGFPLITFTIFLAL